MLVGCVPLVTIASCCIDSRDERTTVITMIPKNASHTRRLRTETKRWKQSLLTPHAAFVSKMCIIPGKSNLDYSLAVITYFVTLV